MAATLSLAVAAAPTITTVAGGGPPAGVRIPGRSIGIPFAKIVTGGDGRLYGASLNRIFRIDPQDWSLEHIAGNGTRIASGDGGPAIDAGIPEVSSLAVNTAGDIYISDGSSRGIRKIDHSTGNISLAWGDGNYDFTPDGQQIVKSVNAMVLTFDGAGELYIAEGYKLRKINLSANTITTIAGTYYGGNEGDGGPAALATLGTIFDAAFGPDGALYFTSGYAIRKYVPSTGTIERVMGTGNPGFSGDGGPATTAEFRTLLSVPAFDSTGNMYIADTYNIRIRKVDAVTGVVSTIAGNGYSGFLYEGQQASQMQMWCPMQARVGANDDILVSDVCNVRLFSISATTGVVSFLLGNGMENFYGNGVAATDAMMEPGGMTTDSSGNLLLIDSGSITIRRIDKTSGLISTIAGNGSHSPMSNDAIATNTGAPANGIAAVANGDIYLLSFNQLLANINASSGIINRLNIGWTGFAGDGGPVGSALFQGMFGIASDTSGNIFISDSYNFRIRKLDTQTGIISTVAGIGVDAISGIGGPAALASIGRPEKLAVDVAGNLYFVSYNQLYRVDANTGTFTHVAGDNAAAIYTEGSIATTVSFGAISHLAISPAGNPYISVGNRIAKIDLSTGLVSTVAGDTLAGFQGDGGPATNARFAEVAGIAFDNSGNLFVSDRWNFRIRKISGLEANDTTAPTVTAALVGQAGTNGWYVSDVGVSWSIVDTETVVVSEPCASTTISTDTVGTTLTCTATSAGGTTSESVTIKRDATAPVATATPSPLPNANGWNKSAVSVTFAGTDATSSVASCSNAVSIATEGDAQTSPTGTCTDNAGNVSAPVSYSPVKIDLTPPVVNVARSPAANAAGWNNTPVIASFAGQDALSGVAADGCSAPITLSASGAAQTASGGCTDQAGNTATASISGINIDLTAPVASASVSPAPNAAGWHKAAATITFEGTDSMSGSGLAGCSTAATVSTDGAAQTRSGTCTDLAGNASNMASAAVNVDTTAPTITLTTPVSGGSYVQNSSTNAAYNCTDALSGIIGCLGTVPNGSAFSTSTVGANSFTVQATDLAGNTASRTVSYTVTAPSPFTLSPSALAFGNRLVNSSTALAVTIRNNSAAALALTAPTLSGANANQFTLARTCGTSLAAGASCTVTATFKPTLAGAKVAAFAMRVGTVTQTVPLSGAGVAVAFTVSPTSLAFGNQARNTTSAKRPVTVTNATTLPITLSTVSLTGTNSNQFVMTRNCGTTLAANASCTVDVQFKPTSTGSKRATLTITPSGATAKTVALTGTGL